MRTFLTVLLPVLTTGLAAQGPPQGFKVETLTRGAIQLSCAIAFAPDGRLFVTERNTGNIRVLSGGTLGPVWARVPSVNVNGSEAGLLGIAVDPDFLRTRHVFVFYTRPGARIWETVLARLEDRNGQGVNHTVLSPAFGSTGGHAGGAIEFGIDGKLYVCHGEANVPRFAQSLANPYGKVLRFEKDGTIPRDNPYAGKAGHDASIWSYGHRNPFGMTMSPFHGMPLLTENSAFRGDEINLIRRGANYGWPFHEGWELFPDPRTEDPLAVFSPDISPTGACFYTGSSYPAQYRNTMFVTDFNTRTVRYLTFDATGTKVVDQKPFHVLAGTVLDVADGPDGNLWVLHHDTPRTRGCDTVSRYVWDKAQVPSVHLSALCNQAVGGAVTVGVAGKNGEAVLSWLALRKLAQPIRTPFGDLWVPLDLPLPPGAITADDRVYAGVPIPALAGLRGVKLHAQAATVSGTTLTLAPPAVLTLP